MNNNMKKIYSLFALIICVFTLNAQTLDRSVRPTPASAKEINIKDAQTFTLPNGLKVFLVEDKTSPIVYYSLQLDVKPALQGDKTGMYDMFGDVFGQATASRSKEQLNKEIDLIGAQAHAHIGGGYISFLKKYENKALELFSDILLNPVFTPEEFDLTLEKYKSYLGSLGDDGGQINERISAALTYGKNYPDGEVLTTKTLENIRLTDLENYYKTYFAPNVARLVIVGDISLKEAKASVEKYFGKWKKKTVTETKYVIPSAPATTEVAYVVKPGAVQSSIDLSYPVHFQIGVPDYEAARLMNLIFGMSGTGRLFLNLRETHSYTYGVYSLLEPDEHIGRFALTSGRGAAAIKAAVTDSAIYEIKNEMQRIIKEPVSEKELRDVKAYAAGNFSRSLERSGTIAGFAVNIDKYKLPKDYYKNYLKRLEAVSIADIQAAAQKYMKPENARIVVTGDKAYAEKLVPFAGDQTIHYYDYDANPVEAPTTQSADISAETLIANYAKALGGETAINKINDYTLKGSMSMAGMTLQLEEHFKKPDLTATILSMNGQAVQRQVYDGATLRVSGMGGNQELTEGDEVDKIKEDAGICPELNYLSRGYILEVAGVETLDGADVYVLNSTKNGKTTTVYFNKESGLKVKSVSTIDTPMGAQQIVTEYSDYREVGGVKMPFVIKQNAGGIAMDVKVETIEVNKGIADSVFQ
jgi:predicted Zn-dependent peptidase